MSLNSSVSAGFYGAVNGGILLGFFYLMLRKNPRGEYATDPDLDFIYYGLILGVIFLVIAGIVYGVSKKQLNESNSGPNDLEIEINSNKSYLAFLIANGVMILLSLIALFINRKKIFN